jgi:hypothetical protein
MEFVDRTILREMGKGQKHNGLDIIPAQMVFHLRHWRACRR